MPTRPRATLRTGRACATACSGPPPADTLHYPQAPQRRIFQMAFQWLRRVLLALAPAALLALAACGGGDIESQFVPKRIVVFGDALSDMGNGGTRYTVNDTTAIWVKLMALD